MSATRVHSPTTVVDVMSTPVVTVDGDTGFTAIVRALEQHRISAVPVVDADGRLVGIVSEADLLLKEEAPMPDARPHLSEGRRHRVERAKAMGRSARELMTAPVVTVEASTTLPAAARLMREKGVKRLPVIDSQGHLAGIVSRADILKVFLRPDAEIKGDVDEDLIRNGLRVDTGAVRVAVNDGVVGLSGEVDRRSDITTLGRLVAAVDGVVGVREDLSFRHDDTHAAPIPPPWLGPFRGLEVGDLLDGYRIESALGEGAWSKTFVARSVNGSQRVVIKCAGCDALGDHISYARFQRELAIMRRLIHPNIQRSLDTGENRSQPYIVLEYVEGEDFRNYLHSAGPLPPEEAVRYAMQLVDALEYMHSQRVVHRDLKPENLLRTPDGQLKVIDFGLALMSGSRRVTRRWRPDAVGTPGYMAPEQIQGKRGDRRADIYALGILLYEMLAGHTPWSGDNPLAIMSQQLNTTPAPLHRYAPGVPSHLEAMTRKMIRKRPEERYQTAAELRQDLRHWEDLDLGRFVFPDECPMPAQALSARKLWIRLAASTLLLLAGSGLGAMVTLLVQHQ